VLSEGAPRAGAALELLEQALAVTQRHEAAA
jgi:hypothetical protein